jgi:photosystem II stability/assembly factor-like uncharacterized protein
LLHPLHSPRISVLASWLLSAALAGCTFYTSCPTGNGNTDQPNNTAGTGGTNGNGGNGNGGTDSGVSGNAPEFMVTDGEIPDGDWRAVMPELSDIADVCGPVFYLSSNPGKDQLLASMFNAGLWSSSDGGDSWERLGTEDVQVKNRSASIVYDPFDPDVFWESGHYGPGAFVTVDGGATFRQLGDPIHLDGLSVDFSDPERNTLLTTGHETGQVLKSVDGGETWDDITETLPSGVKYCRYPLIIDTKTFLLGCGGYVDDGKPATLRSTDGGKTWEKVFENGGGAEPLWASDDAIYWSQEFEGGLSRSLDQGKTWQDMGGGKVIQPLKLVELPDGRIAASTKDSIVLSSDQGKTWKRVTAKTPYQANNFTYSSAQKAFFISRFRCGGDSKPADGDEIQRFDFDYESF